MVAEVRHIIFTTQELSRALIKAHQAKGKALPSGTIHGITQDSRPGVKVTIAIAPDKSDEPFLLEFTEEEVLAALVTFCRENSIPLPAMASKTVGNVKHSLCLVVAINVTEEKLAEFKQSLGVRKEPK